MIAVIDNGMSHSDHALYFIEVTAAHSLTEEA